MVESLENVPYRKCEQKHQHPSVKSTMSQHTTTISFPTVELLNFLARLSQPINQRQHQINVPYIQLDHLLQSHAGKLRSPHR